MMFEIFSTPTSTSASASPSASRSSFFGSKNHWDRFQEEWMVLNEWKWRDLLRLQDRTLSKKSYFVNKLIRFDCLLSMAISWPNLAHLWILIFTVVGRNWGLKPPTLFFSAQLGITTSKAYFRHSKIFWLPSCGNLFTFSYIQSKKLNHFSYLKIKWSLKILKLIIACDYKHKSTGTVAVKAC